jgi:hypothetical protein
VTQSEIIFPVQESPEGGYQARALGFSIFTEADTLDELKTMIRDAVSCHFDPAEKPSVIRLHLVKDDIIPA